MIEMRLALKLAIDHIMGVSEQTEDEAVRDILRQAADLLEAAGALIVKGSKHEST
jgi:hypothetical protein